MNDNLTWITVPREGANDDSVLLVEWLVADGAEVKAGDTVGRMETSKAEFDFQAGTKGWLFHLAQPGDDVPVGGNLGLISSSAARPETKSAPLNTKMKITRKAEALIRQHGIDLAQLDGLSLVRERDILKLLGDARRETTPGRGVTVSPRQQRLAKVLTESYTTIPHSYLSRWLSADAMQARLDGLAGDLAVGFSDLLVHAVSRAASGKANAGWRETEVFEYAEVNLGFALNLSSGDLVVPVISRANKASFEDLVAAIRGFQKKALRNKFTPEDLSCGTVTVTSMLGSGVQQVSPLIVPGQSSILALGDGKAGEHCLTLGFDHRVMNGSEAGAFLGAVAKEMEGLDDD